jgi:hypothetical protein
MSDFVVNATNESGVIKQERMSVHHTTLDLSELSLVRINGLERATKLESLNVQSPIDVSLSISHALRLPAAI